MAKYFATQFNICMFMFHSNTVKYCQLGGQAIRLAPLNILAQFPTLQVVSFLSAVAVT